MSLDDRRYNAALVLFHAMTGEPAGDNPMGETWEDCEGLADALLAARLLATPSDEYEQVPGYSLNELGEIHPYRSACDASPLCEPVYRRRVPLPAEPALPDVRYADRDPRYQDAFAAELKRLSDPVVVDTPSPEERG